MNREPTMNRPALPRFRRPALALTVIASAALLAACGGGSDDDHPPPPVDKTSVPDSALVSSTAYTQFTLTTAQTGSETAEPLSADKVMVPPASETDEPASVG
jgi:hypothetical protein